MEVSARYQPYSRLPSQIPITDDDGEGNDDGPSKLSSSHLVIVPHSLSRLASMAWPRSSSCNAIAKFEQLTRVLVKGWGYRVCFIIVKGVMNKKFEKETWLLVVSRPGNKIQRSRDIFRSKVWACVNTKGKGCLKTPLEPPTILKILVIFCSVPSHRSRSSFLCPPPWSGITCQSHWWLRGEPDQSPEIWILGYH